MSELFDVLTVKQDSPRLSFLKSYIKRYDIQTIRTECCDEPWLAVPMLLARKLGKDEFEQGDDGSDISHVTASLGIFLEEKGLVFCAENQEQALESAVDFLKKREENKVKGS